MRGNSLTAGAAVGECVDVADMLPTLVAGRGNLFLFVSTELRELPLFGAWVPLLLILHHGGGRWRGDSLSL